MDNRIIRYGRFPNLCTDSELLRRLMVYDGNDCDTGPGRKVAGAL